MHSTPPIVTQAQANARQLGFDLSSEPFVGELLAFLAAATPRGGRIVELGTGAGVGLAWIVSGLGGRSDVEVITVDADREVLEATRTLDWPDNVRIVEGDGAREVTRLAPCDLIFADAPSGKLSGLERTIAALRPGGFLVLDDMDLALHDEEDLCRALAEVRSRILAHPNLCVLEVPLSSGVVLATKRRA